MIARRALRRAIPSIIAAFGARQAEAAAATGEPALLRAIGMGFTDGTRVFAEFAILSRQAWAHSLSIGRESRNGALSCSVMRN
jgi:hypothetical protein